MTQLIVLIIFIVSAFAVVFILHKKIPILVQLPQNGSNGFKKNGFISKIEQRIKDLYFHLFSKQMLLHKLLSKFRIWTLKIERKIDQRLHGIRKKAQELDRENGKK